jgi:hypothetical protein
LARAGTLAARAAWYRLEPRCLPGLFFWVQSCWSKLPAPAAMSGSPTPLLCRASCGAGNAARAATSRPARGSRTGPPSSSGSSVRPGPRGLSKTKIQWFSIRPKAGPQSSAASGRAGCRGSSDIGCKTVNRAQPRRTDIARHRLRRWPQLAPEPADSASVPARPATARQHAAMG